MILADQINFWLSVHRHEVFEYKFHRLYKDLEQRIEITKLELSERGVAKGKVVAIYGKNSISYIVGLLSLLQIGAVPFLIHKYYPIETVRKIINRFDPDFVLIDIEISIQYDSLQTLTNLNDFNLHSKYHSLSRVNNDVAIIGLTSGTSGFPKAVLLTNENIISNVRDINNYLKLTSEDRVLIIRPLSHSSVFTGELLVGLSSGSSISILNDYNPRSISDLLVEEGITFMGGSPSMVLNIGTVQRGNFDNKLKKISISGAKPSNQTLQKIKNDFPRAGIFHAYGLTEASPRVTCLLPDEFDKKLGSVGRPLRSVQVKIIGEDGRLNPPMQPGEIVVQGPNVMLGYYGGDAVVDRCLHTGDVGYLDEDGYLFIVGRRDDLMIRAGINIYPIEIEEALLMHPMIRDAYVYGEDDGAHGSRIIALICISCDDSVELRDEIYRHCVTTLGMARIPQEIRIVKKIETNAIGKRVRQ